MKVIENFSKHKQTTDLDFLQKLIDYIESKNRKKSNKKIEKELDSILIDTKNLRSELNKESKPININ